MKENGSTAMIIQYTLDKQELHILCIIMENITIILSIST